MVGKKSYAIIQCVKNVMKYEEYWDKWISDKTLYFKCVEMYVELKALQIDSGQLNSAIARTFGDIVDNYDGIGDKAQNTLGLFRYIAHSSMCPYLSKKEANIILYC